MSYAHLLGLKIPPLVKQKGRGGIDSSLGQVKYPTLHRTHLSFVTS